jgi:hypothetical protein
MICDRVFESRAGMLYSCCILGMYISLDLVEVICRITDIPFPNDFMILSLGRLRFAQYRPRDFW